MPTPTDRSIILAALTAFFVSLSLIIPATRGWLKARRFPLVTGRTSSPVARATRLGIGLQIVGMVTWTALLIAAGPELVDLWRAPRWGPVLGAGLLALGLLAVGLAQLQLGGSWQIGVDNRPTELVSRGVFRAVRNPSYAGVLCMLGGLVAAAPSPWTVGFLINSAVLLAVEARLEEAHLESLHGTTYRAYASRVGRFLPGLGTLKREP